MALTAIIGLLLLGICAGYLGGLAGVGGGMIIVPALVYFFGLSQHRAQGTTLALMLPPIGLLAARQYYRQGYVDARIAVVVIIGYLMGNYLGGKLAVNLPDSIIKRIFALLMLITSVKMLFFTEY
ncbi:MAG TPA: sulfite exporter TauE/SafE family protein [Chitinophagaceae bacterium]|jgi:uncharacterized membrane protein YfcA|nr:sulfite exporter TauE/SafE family protein [Chitinophagaceae bacterium]